MGRQGIALLACVIVFAGCAGPRVVSAPGATSADLPAARGWAPAAAMVQTDFDLGDAPAVDAADTAAPAPAPVAAGFPTAALRDDEPAAPAAEDIVETEDTEEVYEREEVLEVTPSDVAVEPVPDDAPTLGGCCGCKKRCGCCEPRCPCPDPCGNPCGGYVGGNLQIAPGLGGGLEWGINLRRTKTYLLSFEMIASYQDLYDEFLASDRRGVTGDGNSGGKSYALRVGLRWRFAPCCKWHPTLRAGLGWMRLTGEPERLDLAEVDSEGDYLGGYIGAGIEYDINARWSTGPEIALFAGIDPESGDTAIVPTVYWHINYKF